MSARLKLLALLLACSLPALLVYFVFYVVQPQGKAGLGELITPVRAMPGAQASRLDGTMLPLSALKAQWLLIRVDSAACPADCQQQLTGMRQLRLMLGKDMGRVDWLWLVNDQAPIDARLVADLVHDQATVLRLDADTLRDWLPAPAGTRQQDHLYLVDPMGNAMLRWPARLDSSAAARAKRDIEHLLRASASWDQPGR